MWDFTLVTGDRWGGDGEPFPGDPDLELDPELDREDADLSEELDLSLSFTCCK